MTDSEKGLTAEQLQQIRDEIERQIRRLERSMATTEEAMKPVALDQTAVGRLSRIDSLQNQGLTRNLQGREQARLGQLLGALARLDAGTLGRCEGCAGAIAFERLLLFPEAVTCQSCSRG
jgi:DnaK suppressor protein